MSHMLMSRKSHRPAPQFSVKGDLSFALPRVHELCGRSRRTLAIMVAARAQGPVFWIAPSWAADPLNPDGMRDYVAPQKFTFFTPRRPEDLLWCMEEILRSGTVPVVVADLPGMPGLTPVRRLHLAAETGANEGKCRPLGLLLTPGDGGAQGVESRWRLNPAHRTGETRWELDRLRARTAPQRQWMLQYSRQAGVELSDTN
ncbi:MAG: hypothetical protein MK160_14625 [Rhodobacteraceae bacterium]|nr:hypothetical protein [Paracoccaceae bacterium]